MIQFTQLLTEPYGACDEVRSFLSIILVILHYEMNISSKFKLFVLYTALY